MVLMNLATAQFCSKGVLADSALQCHLSLQHYPVWCFLNNQSIRCVREGKQLVLGGEKTPTTKPLRNNNHHPLHASAILLFWRWRPKCISPSFSHPKSEVNNLKQVILLSLKRKEMAKSRQCFIFRSDDSVRANFSPSATEETYIRQGTFTHWSRRWIFTSIPSFDMLMLYTLKKIVTDTQTTH